MCALACMHVRKREEDAMEEELPLEIWKMERERERVSLKFFDLKPLYVFKKSHLI